MTSEADRTEIPRSGPLFRESISRHLGSTAVLAALGAAIDAQVTGMSLDPKLQIRIDEVLDAIGARSILNDQSPNDLKRLLAEIRFTVFQDTQLLFHATPTLAWTHTDPTILQAQGEISAGFAAALTHTIVPQLEGLAQRLESPAGAFLDVGVGVAGLSIELAHLWPSLHVLGIDPWAPSLTLGRENVRRAGLADRIRLQEQAVEDLADTNAFDLAWIPSAFIPEQMIPAACERVYRALRPGGWLLFAMANPGTDPLTAALVRLRTVLWGGGVIAPSQVEILLEQVGFVDVRIVPSPPGALVALIAARRMPHHTK